MKAAGIALMAMALLLASSLPSEAHSHFRGSVWIGPGWGWGPGWWGPSVSYVYTPPPVVVRQEPEVYIQQQPEQQYWYYCQDKQGYFPYVQECPGGWLKVAPTPAPPETEE